MPSLAKLPPLLSSECIALDVQAETIDHVFLEIGRLAGARHGVDPRQVAERLLRRENRRSTALGHGLALPHADTYGLSRPVGVFLRLREAVPFAAPDDRPVINVLALLVPRPASTRHHELLAIYSQLLGRPDFRHSLERCVDASSIWHLFHDHACREQAGSATNGGAPGLHLLPHPAGALSH